MAISRWDIWQPVKRWTVYLKHKYDQVYGNILTKKKKCVSSVWSISDGPTMCQREKCQEQLSHAKSWCTIFDQTTASITRAGIVNRRHYTGLEINYRCIQLGVVLPSHYPMARLGQILWSGFLPTATDGQNPVRTTHDSCMASTVYRDRLSYTGSPTQRHDCRQRKLWHLEVSPVSWNVTCYLYTVCTVYTQGPLLCGHEVLNREIALLISSLMFAY